MHAFSTHWKIRKPYGFLMFPGGRQRVHWTRMSLVICIGKRHYTSLTRSWLIQCYYVNNSSCQSITRLGYLGKSLRNWNKVKDPWSSKSKQILFLCWISCLTNPRVLVIQGNKDFQFQQIIISGLMTESSRP